MTVGDELRCQRRKQNNINSHTLVRTELLGKSKSMF